MLEKIIPASEEFIQEPKSVAKPESDMITDVMENEP